MIGLDTCTIIDILKGDFESSVLDESFAMSSLVFFEAYTYATPPIKAQILKMWNKARKISFDEHSAELASKIQSEARQKGKELPIMDCLIMASYLSAGINRIMTQNAKHYPEMEVVGY